MIIAIHQPNFLPWLGYFNKIIRSDKFVILNEVQFVNNQKKCANGNRVKVLNNGERWLTVSVDKKQKFSLFKDVHIKSDLLESLHYIQVAYRKHPFFKEVFAFLKKQMDMPHERIGELDIQLVYDILDYLDLSEQKGKFVFQEELKTEQTGTDLIIEICKKLGADTYICGTGSKFYQDNKKIEDNNIQIEYQNYQHPHYLQRGSDKFIPGLSIIDLLFNHGKESRKFLEIN
jgi:hypothetical protein